MNEPAETTFEGRFSRAKRFFNRLYRWMWQLQRLWWIVLLTVATGLAVQAYRLWTAPLEFVSLGRMIVNVRIQMSGSTVFAEELSNFLGTQMGLMKSGTVLSRAAQRVQGLRPELSPVPVALEVTVSPKTTIFNLEAVGFEPEYTQAYLQACMEEYMQLKKEMRLSTSDSTIAGLTEQLIALERDLRRAEQDLTDFQASNSVFFVQEQGSSVAAYWAALNRQLAALKAERRLLDLISLDQTPDLAEAREKPDASPDRDPWVTMTNQRGPTTGPFDLLQAEYLKTRQELQLRQAQFQQWSAYLRPKHPRMIALSDEIGRLGKLLDILRQDNQEQVDNRRNTLDLQIKNLEQEAEAWELKSLDVSRKMDEYDRLRTNKQRLQAMYDRVLSTMQTLGIDKDINPETVTIWESASPAFPRRPNPAVHLALGGLAGLLVGVIILMLVDHFDDRPTSLYDLQEAFEEPILGQIPLEKGTGRNSLPLLQLNDERHGFAEAYRNIRSSLLYMTPEGKRPRVLLVTSAMPNDGKSLTAANFAITMAQAGSRVLLVDGDLRKGQLHQQLQVSNQAGLDEVLAAGTSWTGTVQSTAYPLLWLLPRGNPCSHPGELFLRPTTAQFVKDVAQAYDVVVIDGPPVMVADDVATLAPQLDGVLFVLRAGQTSGRIARAALDLLYQRGANVIGLVFNGFNPRTSDYYYYYRYKGYAKQPAR